MMEGMTLEKLQKAMDMINNHTPDMPSSFNVRQSLIVPPDYTSINFPKWSNNRSRRTLKKLIKKAVSNRINGYNKVWSIYGELFCHPSVYENLLREFRQEQYKALNRAMFKSPLLNTHSLYGLITA